MALGMYSRSPYTVFFLSLSTSGIQGMSEHLFSEGGSSQPPRQTALRGQSRHLSSSPFAFCMSSLKKPTSQKHCLRASAPLCEVNVAGQGVHSIWPSFGLYVPTGQSSHSFLAATGWYLPSSHSVHATAASVSE